MRWLAQPHFSKTTTGRTTVATFTATRLDYSHIQAVEDDLNQSAGQTELYLDFTAVADLSSNALGKLIGLHTRAARAGCRLVLTNLNPYVYGLFCVTHLDLLLEVRCRDANAAPPPVRAVWTGRSDSPTVLA